MAPSNYPRIDTHSHILPDFYRSALAETGHSQPDGMPAVPPWSESEHLAMMNNLNIAYSIVSISSPGIRLTPSREATISLCRRVNAFAADLKRRHPSRFGFFASLPLPDEDAALAEVETAFAEGAAGVVLMSSVDGVYVGDPQYSRLWAALDARAAKVFVHPTTPCLCLGPHGSGGSPQIVPSNPLSPFLPSPALEFLFDTVRWISTVLLRSTLTTYPHLTFLAPHAGGALPPLLSRIIGFANIVPEAAYPLITSRHSENEAVTLLQTRFYWDVAGWAWPRQWRMLVEGLEVGKERVLYGSDYPFTREEFVADFVGAMDQGVGNEKEGWTKEEVSGMWGGNAARLFGVESVLGGDVMRFMS
ncbi:amidohydrolase 2 [Trichodelitschia bisporula]|uniref:6-methylsalicylate decarboxylase n=1 Tax=Trichodelitschia bisporula TaxID=703511 RepID=A0A6G1IB91_9PEZI|nr:amidohydrolase 2 [Trichodelitschia bisporula]